MSALCAPGSTFAQVVVYDTNSPITVVSTSSEPFSNNPVFGDSLVLSQGGLLNSVGFSVFNGSSGTILTGTATIRIFDNTNPYSSGDLAATHPLLATVTSNIDFTTLPFGGLPSGFVAPRTADASTLNVTLPQNVLITEQFVETAGSSTAWGTVYKNDSAVGSSPPTVYRRSTATAEGLYTGSTGQYAFEVTLAVPEPTSMGLCGLALAGGVLLKRRRRS
ncbi:MAG TPA: PEP-CTERM sorting domain-containing protein [Gemmataceae bacterium]